MTTRDIPSASHLEWFDCGATDHFHLRLIGADGLSLADASILCDDVPALCEKLEQARDTVQFGADIIHHTGSS